VNYIIATYDATTINTVSHGERRVEATPVVSSNIPHGGIKHPGAQSRTVSFQIARAPTADECVKLAAAVGGSQEVASTFVDDAGDGIFARDCVQAMLNIANTQDVAAVFPSWNTDMKRTMGDTDDRLPANAAYLAMAATRLVELTLGAEMAAKLTTYAKTDWALEVKSILGSNHNSLSNLVRYKIRCYFFHSCSHR
jgi:hypothetical protein